jgi:cytochrome c5
MGAPKYGTADWAPRKAKGKPTLYDHALHGFNSMPAKGGCAACSDEEIKNGVDYMAK